MFLKLKDRRAVQSKRHECIVDTVLYMPYTMYIIQFNWKVDSDILLGLEYRARRGLRDSFRHDE